MTLATHTAIGAGIGYVIGNPIIGFLLGFSSHFLADMIPHGDYKLAHELRVEKKKKKALTLISIDAIASIFVMLIIFNLELASSTRAVSAAIAGSVLPDLLSGLYDVTKSKYLYHYNKFHFFFHDSIVKRLGDVRLEYSVICQLAFIAAVIVWISPK
ncbi:MAG: hypothetical protein ABH846_03700 [Patescibacteria group bacterium]